MKKTYFILILLIFFILFIITHPAVSMHAAASGLLLWYEQILPALLPLAILSNLMVYSNYMQIVTKYLYPLTRHFIATSQNGCLPFWAECCLDFQWEAKSAQTW